MNKSVLITGTSSGIGLETALCLARQGFRVYATMRDLEKRHALEKAAESRGAVLRILELDVTKPETIEKTVGSIVQETGGIYGLVNNAGIAIHSYFEELSSRDIRDVFQTNVFGTMEVTRAVLPHMRKARKGRILLVSSVGGRIGGIAASAYCATKFALEGFGESLFQELMPFGISVVLIEPGMIKTKIWEASRCPGTAQEAPDRPYDEWFASQRQLVGRLLKSSPNTAHDVARTVCRALTAARPRLRYVIGPRAKLVLSLRRYIPGEIFERIYFRAIVRGIAGPSA